MMILKHRIWPAAWLLVALIITAGSFAGGDTSIVAGWAFLIWTAPFGPAWWFILYDRIPRWIPLQVIQVGGELVAVAVAYAFWFIFMPWLRARLSKRSPD